VSLVVFQLQDCRRRTRFLDRLGETPGIVVASALKPGPPGRSGCEAVPGGSLLPAERGLHHHAPLRASGEDLLIIADHFLKVFNVEFKKKVKGFTRLARHVLIGHSWPGNVRELSNCLERAMIFIKKDQIDDDDLIISYPGHPPEGNRWDVLPNGISLEEVERRLIESALKRADGNKSEAARLLGLSRDTLRYRLEKHRLA